MLTPIVPTETDDTTKNDSDAQRTNHWLPVVDERIAQPPIDLGQKITADTEPRVYKVFIPYWSCQLWFGSRTCSKSKCILCICCERKNSAI